MCDVTGSPCEHDGNCVNTPGSFACNCTQGFTGPRCETNVNECESHPCQNDGSCLDDPGTFRCVCMPVSVMVLHRDHKDKKNPARPMILQQFLIVSMRPYDLSDL
uniref:EGF-like domain-containing protein n=1 Tax=Timema douglasi TaxID=61478 RepID=A0A7R8VD76_TIMDO|nr:unnamed protein product [Timema douglasi]